MPISFHIDRDRRVVIADPHGLLTDADIFNYQRSVWSWPENLGYDELIDMSRVTGVELVSTNRVSELAELSGRMDCPATPSKLAIIATADLHFGLGRMYQAHREMAGQGTKTVRVFRERDEALDWLCIRITPERT